MRLRKPLLLGLFAAFCLIFTAGLAVRGIAATNPHFIKIGLQLEPPGLDPTEGAAAAIDEIVSGSVFETLLTVDKNGMVVPLLAKSYTANPDKTEFIFDLNQGVKFHDGSPFNARSVIYTFGRAGAKDSKNVQAQRFSNIVSMVAINDYKVKINLKTPDAGFPEFIASGDADIVSPKSAQNNDTNPIGTGPFKFVEWRKGNYLRLIANENYWRGKPKADGIEYKFISDPSAAYAAMQTGAIDLFPNFPSPESFAALSDNKQLVTRTGVTDGEVMMALNNRIKPFSDIRVRQALAMAIDKQAVINSAMNGFGTPIGSHYSPARSGYIDLTNVYPYNIVRAKQLLAEAGYKNGFAFTLELPPPVYARRSGEIIAMQLAKIGVKVKISQIEWSNWLDKVYARHDFEATIISHAEPYDYTAYARDKYYYGYDNKQILPLFDRLNSAKTESDRIIALADIQTKIAKDVPNIFLFESPLLWVQSVKIHDAFLNSPYQLVNFANIYEDFAASNDRVSAFDDFATKYLPLVIIIVFMLVLGALIYKTDATFSFKKTVSLLLGLFVSSVVIFLITNILPGDPARFILGINATQDAVEALRKELGLENGLMQRYFEWIGGLLEGNFGKSFIYKSDIGQIILERLLVSLPLAFVALFISLAFGLSVGAHAYKNQQKLRGGIIARSLMAISEAIIAIPNYVLAVALIYVIYVWSKAGNFGQFAGWSVNFTQSFAAIFPPALAAGISQGAIIAKIFYEQLLKTEKQSFVTAARGRGLSEAFIFKHNIMPNAIAPLLGVISLQFPYLIGGTAILEAVFALPGLGSLALNAVSSRDLPILQNVVLIMVAIVMVSNFVFEIIQRLIDPRVSDVAGGAMK